MLEFILVDSPVSFPQACVGCMSQKGPMVDTHREVPGLGHVYICHVCGKSTARLLGFAEGERLDELSSASASVADRDREITSLREQLERSRSDIGDWKRTHAELSETLSDREAYIGRLEVEIRTASEATLAAITH